MEVILLEKVENLGNIGDQVNVKSGYGRNFLLPQGKATLATPENIAIFEARRAALEAKQAKKFKAARAGLNSRPTPAKQAASTEQARIAALQEKRAARQAALEMGFRVAGARSQNFSSPRWRTGSGKSR